jgi:hypothetical protein
MDRGTGKKPLTPEAFILRFIETFRDSERSRGVHSVFSGFNAAFREYFPGLDPVEVTTELAEAGKLEMRFVKRGAMLYKPGEAPRSINPRTLLDKMGLD